MDPFGFLVRLFLNLVRALVCFPVRGEFLCFPVRGEFLYFPVRGELVEPCGAQKAKCGGF